MPDSPQIVTLDDAVDIGSLPLLGRSDSRRYDDPSLQVFGQIATNPANLPATLLPQRTGVAAAGKVQACRDTDIRMRRIRSSGFQVVRSVAEPVGPLSAQTIGPIDDGCNRAGSFGVLIETVTPEGFSSFYMDVGQTLDMLCGQVNLTFVGPNAGLVSAPPFRTLDGLVVDALLGVSVIPIESVDGGHRRVTFSEQIRIPAGTALQIQVPSFAKEAKVYMANGSTSSTGRWDGFSGSGTALVPECFLLFDATNVYTIDETREIGGAQVIITDVDQNNDRLFTVIWQIEP